MTGRFAIWRERPLSAGERAIAADVFGAGFDPQPIRLVKSHLAPGGFAIATPFDRVVFCAQAALPDDFARMGPGEQAWLVHELTHIWQSRNGIALPLAKCAALGRSAYRWTLKPGWRFLDYNIEQQAEMTASAFLWALGWQNHEEAGALQQAFRREAAAGAAPLVFRSAAQSRTRATFDHSESD